VLSLVNTASVTTYSSGSVDDGPRETYTDVPRATASIGVNSSNVSGRAVFSKETAGSSTQNGVVGATVSIVGTSFTTTTDSSGKFSFSGVPNGTYTVRAVSVYGDVLGEEAITVNNADVHDVVFQARPRIVLTKTTSTAGPVSAGQSIDYTLNVQNVGNYPAFQIANIVDVMVKGMETSTLLSAEHSGTDVTGVSGFSFQQSGLTLSVTVRNPSGEARLNPGESFEVVYRVAVSAALRGASITIPNSATLASYATTASSGATTETYVDVRCGEVRLESADSYGVFGRAVFSKETAGSTEQNGIAGVTVSIVGTSFTTTTDADGNFSFSDVPNGSYTVRAVSAFGDVLGEETITLNNADVRNVVFQARPRIVLTKTTSTIGPVSAGQSIEYTLTVQNVGNYPAFQIANIVDEMGKGMETATLITAEYSGADVTSVSGFSFSQNGLTLTIAVANPSGEARIDPGERFEVAYRVAVSATLKGASITIPNSATIASYASTAVMEQTTEVYVDVRCGDVRVDVVDDVSGKCQASSLETMLTSIDTQGQGMERAVSRAVALRKQYAAAGYCKARDNGCFKCNKNRSKCINVCRLPSAKADRDLNARAGQLGAQITTTAQDGLLRQVWSLECSIVQDCELSDLAAPKDAISNASRKLQDMVNQVLDSCCLRTQRAGLTLKRRRSSIRQAARRDFKKMNSHIADYPSPALVCR
jgi:fimbrial isopeptide formation D2 family protein